ncbi:MAG TPA: hypothetical protein V6C72_00490 [Chroococcales cyanobacterium]
MKTVQRLAIFAVTAISLLSTTVPVQAQYLQGRVGVDEKNSAGNGLNRSDLGRNSSSDPFANNSAPSQDAFAPASFDVGTLAPPPPTAAQKAFDLNANDTGGGEFQGTPGQAVEAPLAMAPPTFQQQVSLPQQMNNPADPDSSPEMRIAWDAWHKRVAEAIYVRFTASANKFFPRAQLAASAAYTVTKDGRITNVRMLQKNWNPIFNAMIIASISALDGQAQFLAFPPGSRRASVEKSGTFTQNYGQNGFRSTINDQEQYKQR